MRMYFYLCLFILFGCKPKLKNVENIIINGFESKFHFEEPIPGRAYKYDNDSIVFLTIDGTLSSYWKQHHNNDTLIVEKHEYYRERENFIFTTKTINNNSIRTVKYFTKYNVYLGSFEFNNLDLVKSDYKGEYLEGRRVILTHAINSMDSVTYNFEVIDKIENNFAVLIYRDIEFHNYMHPSVEDVLYQNYDYKNSIKITWPKNYFKDGLFPLHMRILEYNDDNHLKADVIYKINLHIPEQDTLVLIHP